MRYLQDLRFRVCSNILLFAANANLYSFDSVLLPYMTSRQIPRQPGRQACSHFLDISESLFVLICTTSTKYKMPGEMG